MAEMISESCARAACIPSTTSWKLWHASTATWTLLGRRGVAMATFVMTPSVPSLPISRWCRWYPVLSFRSEETLSTIVPSARTASTPSTVPCSDPYRTSLSPPAFVATLPPIWQLPFAPRSSGTMKPFSARCESKLWRMHPAPQTTTASCALNDSISLRRLVDSTISSWTGTLPPTSPVFPPCGTTAIRLSLQYRKIADTCSVFFGFSATCAAP
mmetsp:Transcript_60322/g.142121  ORF Transcript_60322/g.142121 Transcript_60322/m.142121 type:complete len:214 (+) Transcript_60322:842-1483(+)